MTTLKFADSHNMVAFLTKSAESEGFEQIATVKVKTINGEVQLQALVDGKKVIVTEASVRCDLQLDDEEGMDCLSNATIFEELTIMGYEKLSQKLTFYKAFFSPQWKFLIHTILQCLSAKNTAWNEFSSTMASAIICLATNQKFNFSKYIFESMVKILDNAGKFLMYPRFVQVFLDNQLKEMEPHNRTYIAPSYTNNIFANMRRQGKDFSGRVTPLFPTMVVQAQEEIGKGLAIPTDPYHTPMITQPSSSQPQRKQKSKRPKTKDTEIPQSSGRTTDVADEAVYKERDNSLVRAATTDSSLKAEQDSGGGPRRQDTIRNTIARTRLKLDELMEFCTQLQQRVLDLENTKTAQAQEITSLKLRVKRLEKKERSRTHKLKRLYKVGRSARVISSNKASLGDQEDASKQERKINDIDKDAEITLVDETQGRYGDEDMFGVHDLDGDEVVVESEVTDKAGKKRNIVEEAVDVTDVVTIPVSAAIITNVKSQGSKDKGKAMMIELEKPLKKKDQIKFDEEEALRLQAEFDEEDRLAREKA
ncbi:hypothetical protein Tco_1509373 [Tanacetum coccineum]